MAGKFRLQAAFWGMAAVTLAGCGFKGDLYLPKENDPASFGAIQTGIGIAPPPGTAAEENHQEKQEEK